MIRNILIFLNLMACSCFLQAQNFENGFDFNLPYNDSATVEYLPHFPNHPITDADRVSTDSSGNFIVKGMPYRFYGGNCTTQAAFPLKEDAALIAGRMRKFGMNLIRFHHIDNPWSEGSLFHTITGTRAFNPILLDRLDYFIFQLKRHGIYVDMNLNVSRTFEEVDGVVDADSLSDYGKGVTQFDSHMISLQKEYASMLLGHVNPYTGTSLASDPVLAMIEIINENSLFRMWYSGALTPISKGGKLPLYYHRKLDSLWHDYLVEKYDSTKYLAIAWNKNRVNGDTLFFDGFENGIGSDWQMELHNSAAATMQTTGDAATGNFAALVNITALSTETWHTQFKNVGQSIRKDSIYELIFKAKANESKALTVSFMRDNSPWTYYTGEDLLVDTMWQEYKVSFAAPEDNPGSLRISFGFEHNLGEYFFDDLLFKTENNQGLLEDELLEERSVNRLGYSDFNSFTRERIMDQTEFYTGVQVHFLTDMQGFLRDSLGVTAPITGTNWFTGPEDVYVQNTLDYIDNHAYWDHPNFPNQSWSPTDWTITNNPMVTSGSGTIENLFNGLIVQGKPYTVSEYNHAYPNQYQSELLPMITAYLSYHDADGFMIFTYSGSWDWDEDMVDGYFDIHRNSNLMGNFPLFSFAFRNYLIGCDSIPVVIEYSHNNILGMPLSMSNWWSSHYPYSEKLGLMHRMEMSFDHEADFDAGLLPEVPSNPYLLNNGQIFWDKEGIFMINTPNFISICGYLNTYSGASTEAMEVESAAGFGSVSWLSLSDSALDQTSRSVLAIGSKMMNAGMVWDGTTTVHNNWGGAPALVYPLNPVLKLRTRFSFMRISPLNELGQVIQGSSDTIAADSMGFVTVTLDQSSNNTLWFGIEALNYEEPVIPEDTTTLFTPGYVYTNLKCYPNPARDVVHFELVDPEQTPALLRIFDLTGSMVWSERIRKKLTIPATHMSPGTYYYHLKLKDGVANGKIVLLKG